MKSKSAYIPYAIEGVENAIEKGLPPNEKRIIGEVESYIGNNDQLMMLFVFSVVESQRLGDLREILDSLLSTGGTEYKKV